MMTPKTTIEGRTIIMTLLVVMGVCRDPTTPIAMIARKITPVVRVSNSMFRRGSPRAFKPRE
jgi:hypothetical protein